MSKSKLKGKTTDTLKGYGCQTINDKLVAFDLIRGELARSTKPESRFNSWQIVRVRVIRESDYRRLLKATKGAKRK